MTVYRDLLGKRIGLVGSEKICADLQEFFCELHFAQVLTAEEITDREVSAIEGCDYVLVGEEREHFDREILQKCRQTALTLDDLYEMIDELETFYIDKLFPDRTVCVYGSQEKVFRMMQRNPHLKIDYVIADGQTENDYGFAVIPPDQIGALQDAFVIIADDVSPDRKQKFQDAGLEFGRDFHFYNPRIPRRPTSWYLNKTLRDAPKYTIPCDYTTKALSIKAHGNIMACCSSVGLSMGNSLYTSVEEILRGVQAQLIRLSVNNRTYSFCGDMCYMFRERQYCLEQDEEIKKNPRAKISLREIKDFNVQLGYDRSCNLACSSCRDHRITKPEDDPALVEMIHEEVKRMCLRKPGNMRIGNGELFFSPYYRDIIFNCYESDEIALISNGMLFNPDNWSYLENRYEKISLEVSMDAVNPDTYRKLRGGDLDKLRKNMEFASRLRLQNKLKRLSVSFVIQADNYREMADFVQYGRSIHADFIHFMKLNSWGHIPSDEFIQMDVYDERNVHHEDFVRILQNPIFLEPDVHVDNIGNFIGGKK